MFFLCGRSHCLMCRAIINSKTLLNYACLLTCCISLWFFTGNLTGCIYNYREYTCLMMINISWREHADHWKSEPPSHQNVPWGPNWCMSKDKSWRTNKKEWSIEWTAIHATKHILEKQGERWRSDWKNTIGQSMYRMQTMALLFMQMNMTIQ